ncbi:hypothetical protein AB6805_23240 [Chitinophaga sp. RCC_12]|uniref:hypothetical protein n=1 Tax=Chitinophaga sp. RCC_12 TaxID=3239226 RepID=UPI0035237864
MKKLNVAGMVLATAFVMPFIQSCSKTPDTGTKPDDTKQTKEYAIFVTVGNSSSSENYYTLTTADLMKDTLLSPVNSGIEPDNITSWAYIYSVFYQGSFYYTQDGNIISKQKIVGGKYKELGNIVASAGSWQLGMMKTFFNNNGLNFLSWEVKYNQAEDVIEKNLYIIDTAAMTVKSNNPVKFPVPAFTIYDNNGNPMAKKDIPLTPSSFSIRDNKAFIGFYYDWITKIDTAYMLVCDYPALTNVKLLKDTRLGHVSGAWYASSSSFTDENGDYYFSTINKNKTYGLLRIKSGTTEIDPGYAYDLKEVGNIAGAASWGDYAGSDHHVYIKSGLAFMGSYMIDVRNKKVIKDLNSFGLGKVQMTMDTYTENSNEVYVVLKTDDARWFVGKYDVAANTLKRGVEIHSGIKGISRIGRLR